MLERRGVPDPIAQLSFLSSPDLGVRRSLAGRLIDQGDRLKPHLSLVANQILTEVDTKVISSLMRALCGVSAVTDQEWNLTLRAMQRCAQSEDPAVVASAYNLCGKLGNGRPEAIWFLVDQLGIEDDPVELQRFNAVVTAIGNVGHTCELSLRDIALGQLRSSLDPDSETSPAVMRAIHEIETHWPESQAIRNGKALAKARRAEREATE